MSTTYATRYYACWKPMIPGRPDLAPGQPKGNEVDVATWMGRE